MIKTVHMSRRLLSLLLAVIMLLGTLCMTAAAATKENVKQYGIYTCLGDSISAGYTVEGTENYAMCTMPGAYHSIVAEATGAKLQQFGWSAFRSVELRYMLEGEIHDPDYQTWHDTFGALIDTSILDEHRDDYLAAIDSADLITINVGSNDVVSYSFGKAINELYNEDNDNPLYKAAKEYLDAEGDPGAAMLKLLKGANTAGKVPVVLATLTRALRTSINNFKQNFNASINDIYQRNPDVTIVVVGLYNAFSGMVLSEDSKTNLGFLLQPTVDSVNFFLK